MRHAFANRMLFALVVGVVVTLPFLFHRGGGEDATGGDASTVMAMALVDPYAQQANQEALAEGRATTLSDVVGLLPPADAADGSSPAASAGGIALPAPVFTVATDRITAALTALGTPVTCVITISGAKAVTRC